MKLKESRCRICDAAFTGDYLAAKEMMFGTKKTFEYFQCATCGCLQISSIPKDIEEYYPSNYYSFSKVPPDTGRQSYVVEILTRWRVKQALFGIGYKQAHIAKSLVKAPAELKSIGELVKRCRVRSFGASFLDVGCGSSSWWLQQLKSLGFRRLSGVDPFIEKDVKQDGIHIARKHLEEMDGKFDVISMHHSLEHLPQQIETLRLIAKRLKPSGSCLLRIPLVSSLVWEMYGANWVELDAPRHLYLHSVKSIELAAKMAGMRIYDRFWDSTEFEFWGSEQYVRGIPLMSDKSYLVNPSMSEFTFREMARFRSLAEQANRECRGGRGCFFLELLDK